MLICYVRALLTSDTYRYLVLSSGGTRAKSKKSSYDSQIIHGIHIVYCKERQIEVSGNLGTRNV
jgi:hypothetical protein